MSERSKNVPVYARVGGKDQPAAAVLVDLMRRLQAAPVPPPDAGEPPARPRPIVVADPQHAHLSTLEADYAMIDGTLAVVVPAGAVEEPAPGLGFAGFSAAQRGAWFTWLQTPTQPAPEAFRTLLLANLEVRRLEPKYADRAHSTLLELSAAAAWQGHAGLGRTLLLSFWLAQDGPGLGAWLDKGLLPPTLWPLALGHLALLGRPLSSAQAQQLGTAWGLAPVGHTIPAAAIALRLETLTNTLGAEPLAAALAALGPAAAEPKPWRMHHRDLHLRLPQPALRSSLEPQLAELWRFAAWEPEPDLTPDAAPEPEPPASAQPDTKGHKKSKEKPGDLSNAHIIIEFGHSNSPMIEYVLQQARKQPGFQQLLDENRHLIYRVPYRRNELTRFWRLYDIVQNWSSTRVYANGRTLEQWQIYPYSQYMR